MQTEKPPDDPSSKFTCIKTSLKNIIKYKHVQNKISDVVITCNKIVIHALQFLKLYLIHKFENNEELPVINKSFIVAILKVVCTTPTKGRPPSLETQALNAMLKEFYDLHYSEFQPETLSYQHLNTTLDYLAISIVTMYENNIKQHYIEYIERYVNVIWRKKEMLGFMKKMYKSKIYDERKNKLCKQLRRIKKDFIMRNNPKKSDSNYHDWIDSEILKILPVKEFEQNSVYYDLQCNPQDYLPCMLYMMKKIETYGVKINNVCPLRTDIIPKHILIDTTTLALLFINKKHGKIADFITKGNLVKRQDEIWTYFFRTERKIFNLNNTKEGGYKFNYMINTDGVSCSILLLKNIITKKRGIKTKKSKKDKNINKEKYINELENEEYKTLINKNVVAIDPNQSDLIYCINDKKETFRYTQDQRRKEMKIKKQRKFLQKEKKNNIIEIIEEKQMNVINVETTLSLFNKKTLIINDFKRYISKKNEINTKLESFYHNYIYRKLKLNSYISCKRSESRMIKNFESKFGSPKDTIIGFGDYEQYKQRKYKEPVKGKGFRTLFRKAGYQVYLVDEHKTSARCSFCRTDEGICKPFRKCINPRPWKSDIILRHGLTKCKTCCRLWNRDTNASSNIHCIIKNEILRLGRPEYLKRKKKQPLSDTTSVSD